LKKGVNPILGLASKERIDKTMEMIGFELAEDLTVEIRLLGLKLCALLISI